jgi:CRP-like cAMP-binding protein
MRLNLTLEKLIGFLLEVEMFASLDVAELSEIVSIMDIQTYKSNDIVFSEGDIGDAWYTIYSGVVSVERNKPFHDMSSVAEFGPACCFGEMAILDDAPRSATITVCEPTILFRFSRTKFERLLDSKSLGAYKLVYGMACVLAQRQRRLNNRISELTQEIDFLDNPI